MQFLNIVLDALPALIKGAGTTIFLAALSILLGLIGGSLMGIARLSPIPVIRIATQAYIEFFRGTPLLVQIFMVYFGLPALFQSWGVPFSLDRPVAAVLALSLNATAYVAEIVRAGIQSIEVGQREASESLGLTPFDTMRYIIFPQAFRRMIPPLGNEFITLVKDTSLVAVIGYEEVFRSGQLIVATTYRAFEIYAAVALVYLVITFAFSRGISQVEHWMNPTSR